MHPLNSRASDHYWNPYVKQNIDTAATGQGTPDYSQTGLVEAPSTERNVSTVISDMMSHLFTSMNNPHHPMFQTNVIPPTTIPASVAAITGMRLNSNIIDEHYSLNVAKAEMELWSMLGRLLPVGTGEAEWPAPWSPPAPDAPIQMDRIPSPQSGSGGIVTFGGTGCYFYGIKYALATVANSKGADSRADGVEQGRFVFMVSNQGHYCHSNISDWCGLGYNNVIKIQTLADNTMDLANLEARMNEAKAAGKIIVGIVGTFGTTDAGALDDLTGIRAIINRFDNNDGYAKPFLYGDSVIGWIYLFFRDYDFSNNPLEFDADILSLIQENAAKATGLAQADAFGIDFHKTGFSHYAASMVMFRDYGAFATLMQRPSSPYLQAEQYDPGLYTLETSRSSVGSAGPWATFQYLGKRGMQVLMYNLIARQSYLRDQISSPLRSDFAICNADNHLYSTLMRLYPLGTVDAQAQYAAELTDESLYAQFMANNELQRAYYQLLYSQLREQTNPDFPRPPHPSLTTGFRYTAYNPDGAMSDPDTGNPMQGVFALKSFVCTPFVDNEHMDLLVQYLVLARDTVAQNLILANRSWEGADELVLGNPPAGSHPYNHLIVATHIPNRFLVPRDYDFASDPTLDNYLEQLDASITATKARIADLQQ